MKYLVASCEAVTHRPAAYFVSFASQMIRHRFECPYASKLATDLQINIDRLLSYWLSKKERRVDALALRAEERRDKLRKAVGSCT